MRILVVDDEPTLVTQLRDALHQQHYTVDIAEDGNQALLCLFDNEFDLLILDIMLPGRDGLSVLRGLRAAGMTMPVLMLTARGDIRDRITGLDLGADDYLAKPFSVDELLARVRALLRRGGTQGDTTLQAGDLKLDPASRSVTRGNTGIELTTREFSILEFLLYNKDRAVSRFNLAEHVWGEAFDPFSMSNFLDVHIMNLRRKLGDDGSLIQTVRGVGYIIRTDKS